MRHETRSKDCSLAGASDLTVIAPIRQGFVPGLDAVTYKTRVQRVLRTLHAGRSGLHESEPARILSDAVERVGRIHSVRMAVLEPHDQVLLSVTFDGAWESYVRVIWQKVVRLLDLVFCNTENYVNGWESSFEEWGLWLRSRQAETSFLYAVPGLTMPDTLYLRMQERLARAAGSDDLAAARISVPSAEDIAEGLFASGRNPSTLPPSRALQAPTETQPAVFRQGLRSLVGLYRLADLYPPSTGDGEVLLRAAHELLPEFTRVTPWGDSSLGLAWKRAIERFDEQLKWFAKPLATPRPRLPRPRLPSPPPATPDLNQPQALQAGILEPYGDVDHGVVLLLGFSSPAAVRALIAAVPPTTRDQQPLLRPGTLACNLAFSLEGLRMAGLTDAEVDMLPTEFVQGMERRASTLGDLRINHPRHWRLPMRNWAQGALAIDAPDDDPGERVPLAAVHAVLQLRRMRVTPSTQTTAEVRAALYAELKNLVDPITGVVPLSLQWLTRLHSNGGTGNGILDHFGFLDGGSDPVLTKAQAGAIYPNHVHAGEALVGYPNAGDVDAPRMPQASAPVHELLHNGSFLVVRKLRQDWAVLGQVLDDAQAPARGLDHATLLAKMMGRWPETGNATPGAPLAELPPARKNDNDFDFEDDPEGSRCPLHAHIRRANPRETPAPTGSRPPRLFRRSLSYGPRYDPAQASRGVNEERGLFFMAYNASLGEQFEVVQRWLSGGNSSHGYSSQSDPFLGVPEPGCKRVFRFEHAHGGSPDAVSMALDGDTDLLAEPKPLVRLEWGGYFFTPSLAGLAMLARRAPQTADLDLPEALGWSLEQGELAIARLRKIEATEGSAVALREWKAALEDPQAAADFTTASIWAAIRQKHDGVLRTPYGVLVATRDAVNQLLHDPARQLTSIGYLPRMRQSFGAIYLGMDAGQEDGRYERESRACNDAIEALARDAAARTTIFTEAQATVANKLKSLADKARRYALEDERLRLEESPSAPRDRLRWEVTLDVRELIDELLATYCEKWFGLSEDGKLLQRSGFRWNWRVGEPPCYPGHFMAPSRYIFQPHPEALVESVGIAHGQAMLAAMTVYLQDNRDTLKAPVARAVLATPPTVHDLPLAARNLVGALMGMVPTVDANLRRVMDRWLSEGTLWSLRSSLMSASPAVLQPAIEAAFRRTMQSRVAPDTLWRTAQRGHTLGTDPAHAVQVVPGDVLVAGLVSAAHQGMEAPGAPDVAVAFGGNRGATGHPTHACPGYQPALAMMEGFAAALVCSTEALRPGPGPLTLTMSGYVPNTVVKPTPTPLDLGQWLLQAQLQDAALSASLVEESSRRGNTPLDLFRERAAGKTVWAYGDSWLSDRDLPFWRSSLSKVLHKLGYLVDDTTSARGLTLASMADGVATGLARKLRRLQSGEIHALLIGGGGNDIANDDDPGASVLHALLKPDATKPEDALDEHGLKRFVDVELKGYYQVILPELLVATEHLGIPILVHAYAHPIADNRSATLGSAGPWLHPAFALKCMHSKDFNTRVMRVLINRLNEMVGTLVSDLGGGRLKHCDLRGMLHDQWDATGLHEAHWADELHPNGDGFGILVTRRVLQEIPV